MHTDETKDVITEARDQGAIFREEGGAVALERGGGLVVALHV